MKLAASKNKKSMHRDEKNLEIWFKKYSKTILTKIILF